jgi:hypothetical protein
MTYSCIQNIPYYEGRQFAHRDARRDMKTYIKTSRRRDPTHPFIPSPSRNLPKHWNVVGNLCHVCLIVSKTHDIGEATSAAGLSMAMARAPTRTNHHLVCSLQPPTTQPATRHQPVRLARSLALCSVLVHSTPWACQPASHSASHSSPKANISNSYNWAVPSQSRNQPNQSVEVHQSLNQNQLKLKAQSSRNTQCPTITKQSTIIVASSPRRIRALLCRNQARASPIACLTDRQA